MHSYSIKDFQDTKVWSYSRVSSKEQFERNSSIETQVMAIKDFAQSNRLIITKEFDATYESSKSLSSQKTLLNLVKTLKETPLKDRPKLILIWSPSRFGRSGVGHISLLSSLRVDFDVRIYAVSNGKCTFDERHDATPVTSTLVPSFRSARAVNARALPAPSVASGGSS